MVRTKARKTDDADVNADDDNDELQGAWKSYLSLIIELRKRIKLIKYQLILLILVKLQISNLTIFLQYNYNQ